MRLTPPYHHLHVRLLSCRQSARLLFSARNNAFTGVELSRRRAKMIVSLFTGRCITAPAAAEGRFPEGEEQPPGQQARWRTASHLPEQKLSAAQLMAFATFYRRCPLPSRDSSLFAFERQPFSATFL